MGACISALVNAATRLHDFWIERRWGDLDETNWTSQIKVSSPAPPTSIHVAVVNRSERDIQQILEQDPGAAKEQNSAGETALHQACSLGYVHIARALLKAGCPAGVVTSQGSALHSALHAVQSHYISEAVCVDFLQELVSAGCDVNAIDRGEKTALLCAVESKQLRAIKMLVALGADVNCAEAKQFSPLYMATINGNLASVRFLLSCPGICVNAQDAVGRTPLMAALITVANRFRMQQDWAGVNRLNGVAVAEALLAAGADPTIADNYGRTAIVIALDALDLDRLSRLHLWPESDASSESIYAPLLRLLFLAGGRLSMPRPLGPAWLQQLLAEEGGTKGAPPIRPFPLMHLCRAAIRGRLADVGRLQQLEQLPAPHSLMGYLRVDYI